MSNEPLLEHSKITCFIGLGANLGNPIQQINAALAELKFSEKVDLLDSSPLYRSEPMGPQDQDDYINAVAKIETNLSPIGLLDYLQQCVSTLLNQSISLLGNNRLGQYHFRKRCLKHYCW